MTFNESKRKNIYHSSIHKKNPIVNFPHWSPGSLLYRRLKFKSNLLLFGSRHCCCLLWWHAGLAPECWTSPRMLNPQRRNHKPAWYRCLPGWADTWIVMPEPEAVQFPQRGPSTEEEDIQSPLFKHCLLGVTKVMGLTPSCWTIKGDNHLKQGKTKYRSSNMIIWFFGYITKENHEDRETGLRWSLWDLRQVQRILQIYSLELGNISLWCFVNATGHRISPGQSVSHTVEDTEQWMKNIFFINLSCCRGPSSISSGDLNEVVKLRAGVIISQDSDLHLQEEQNQEHWLTFT